MKWTWPTVWADERGGWWKLLTTLALVAGGVIVGIFLFYAALVVFGLLKNESAYVRYIEVVMVVGIAFGFGLAGLLIGIRQVHNKPVACVFTDGRPFNFRLAFQSGALWVLMIFLYSWFWTNNGAEALVRGAVEIPRARWLVHLIVMLCAATLMETSAAVLFWGYVQTRVGAWVKRPWLAVCISVLPFTMTAMIFKGMSAAAVSDAIVDGIVGGTACIRAGTLAPLVSANIVSSSLMTLLYPNRNITWSYAVFDALAMAIWFVWLLWATRRRS